MLLLLALAVCSGSLQVNGGKDREEADAAHSESRQAAARARKIYSDYFEASLKLNPLRGTYIGDHRYDDRLANSLSREHRQKELALHERALKRIREIDPESLSGEAKLSYEIFVRDRRLAIEGYPFPSHLIPVDQFFSLPNLLVQLGSGSGAQPFKTVEDYREWLSRMDDFEVWVDQAIENMRRGIECNVVQPKILMKRVLPQLASQKVDDPTQSAFYKPIQNMPEDFPAAERKKLRQAYRKKIETVIVPAYARLHAFIEGEYLEHARDTFGMGALPNGKAWYRHLIRDITTTDLSPQRIHKIGRNEIDRIHDAMRRIKEQMGFEGDLNAFFKHMKETESYYFDSEEALLEGYRDLRRRVEANIDTLFCEIPDADFEIRPVEEFREKSAAAAFYQPAAPDGSRPGVFYVNTYDLDSRPKWSMQALFLHEAIPGHHFQISLKREMEQLPRFRRFGGNTAFTEGWALYAESLGKELGLYQDPAQYFGRLNYELWRAIRLVVDTGLHVKGWSRQKVLDYMQANSAVSKSRAVAEAERYMAIPAQALAYKIGQRKIAELRNGAKRELGEELDLRAFHREVIGSGALPLNILDQKVERWISQRNGSAK